MGPNAQARASKPGRARPSRPGHSWAKQARYCWARPGQTRPGGRGRPGRDRAGRGQAEASLGGPGQAGPGTPVPNKRGTAGRGRAKRGRADAADPGATGPNAAGPSAAGARRGRGPAQACPAMDSLWLAQPHGQRGRSLKGETTCPRDDGSKGPTKGQPMPAPGRGIRSSTTRETLSAGEKGALSIASLLQ